MNKKIILTSLGYILCIVLIVVGTNHFIDNKSRKLYKEACDSFDNFFRNQDKFIDTDYSNQSIKYVQCRIPEKPTSALLEYAKEDWDTKFSDIFQLYEINKIFKGWQLFVAEKHGHNTMLTYEIYPSYVGYITQESPYYYSWIPSVETCVEESYDFWINNPKSQHIEFYKKGSKKLVNDFIKNFGNKYFRWDENTNKIRLLSGSSIGTAGYMYNGYYKAFAEMTQYATYEVIRNENAIMKEKKKIIIVSIAILTAIFLCIITPMIRDSHKEKERKESKVKLRDEPLYNKLKRLCNPSNFMNPYDEVKVDKANNIFNKISKISSDDIDSLKQLRKQAIDELGIKYINEEYLEGLKAKCNPKQFLEPYNPEKVKIANALYNKLIHNDNDIEIMEEIEKEIRDNLS